MTMKFLIISIISINSKNSILYYSNIFYYSVYKNIIKPDVIFFNWFLFIIVWKYDCIRNT